MYKKNTATKRKLYLAFGMVVITN